MKGLKIAKRLLEPVYIDNTEAKTKRTTGQTIIYKILHRKLRSEQEERNSKTWVNTGAPKGYAVPAQHVTPIVIFILQTRI
jgi:hypothetical protein